jgi:hypothetical protein
MQFSQITNFCFLCEAGNSTNCEKYSAKNSNLLHNRMLFGVFTMNGNGLQLQEVGDFGDENCLPAQNLI